MKKLFLFCFAACLSVVASGQKVYFLYLQTDDYTPFYVRMASKIYSSSTSGYLILPNLTDSTYQLGLGFAKSTQPETKFAVVINQNDKGYLVKNFTDGLGLFDMQELSIVKAVSAVQDNTVYETKSDKFSSTLSKAADDPTLLKVPVAKKEEPKPKAEEKVVVTAKAEDTKPIPDPAKEPPVIISVTTAEANTEKKQDPVNTEVKTEVETKPPVVNKTDVKEEVQNSNLSQPEYKPSTIVRRSESSTTEGFGIVFYDKMDGKTDTIRIVIPPSKSKVRLFIQLPVTK